MLLLIKRGIQKGENSSPVTGLSTGPRAPLNRSTLLNITIIIIIIIII